MWKTLSTMATYLDPSSCQLRAQLQVADTNLCHVQHFDNRFAHPSMRRPAQGGVALVNGHLLGKT